MAAPPATAAASRTLSDGHLDQRLDEVLGGVGQRAAVDRPEGVVRDPPRGHDGVRRRTGRDAIADRALVELDEHECWRLLRGAEPRVGRLAFNVNQHPMLLPVNYTVDDRTIVVRFSGDTIVDEAVGTRVAFEVDHVEPEWERGWSVVVQGLAKEAMGRDELARMEELDLRAWAASDRVLFLRILPRHGISGRTIR